MSKVKETNEAFATRAALSPMAKEVLAAILPASQGEDSQIPPSSFVGFQKRLKHLTHDRECFEHLCVLWIYLNKQGLSRASGQLLELAKIGLEPSAIEKASQHIDSMRKSAKALNFDRQNPNAKALSPRNTIGIGLGRRPKKE